MLIVIVIVFAIGAVTRGHHHIHFFRAIVVFTFSAVVRVRGRVIIAPISMVIVLVLQAMSGPAIPGRFSFRFSRQPSCVTVDYTVQATAVEGRAQVTNSSIPFG